MKILTLTHYFSTHRGGVELVAGQLAQRLAARPGTEVTWMASGVDPVPVLKQVRFLAVPAFNGLEQAGLPWPIWGPSALRDLRREVAATDVVHVHDFIYGGNLAAMHWARRMGKPVIITQHIGDIPYDHPLLRGTLKAVNRTIGRWTLARANQVIFISRHVQEQFSRFTRFGAPPLFWPNGVDHGLFSPLSAQERQSGRTAFGVAGSKGVLLFVGRFVEKKGLALLRALASALPELEWWFAGWGEASSPLHPDTWGLGNVRVFPDRSGASLAELYRLADLLVLPSKGEGFPLVVQEAMACGTPAMVAPETAAGAAGDAPLHAVPLGLEGWVEAIRGHLAGADRVLQRERVATFAREAWSWDHLAGAYHALFERLAQGPPGVP